MPLWDCLHSRAYVILNGLEQIVCGKCSHVVWLLLSRSLTDHPNVFWPVSQMSALSPRVIIAVQSTLVYCRLGTHTYRLCLLCPPSDDAYLHDKRLYWQQTTVTFWRSHLSSICPWNMWPVLRLNPQRWSSLGAIAGFSPGPAASGASQGVSRDKANTTSSVCGPV